MQLGALSCEPQHDKTNKMAVSPAKTQISLSIHSSDQSLRCPHEESYPMSAQLRLCSDWADALADLSLRWTHSHFVGFVISPLMRFEILMEI